MTPTGGLRAIPTADRAWLIAALGDALNGGAPVLPVSGDADETVIAALQAAPLPTGTALVLRTSGSTGVPKAVALSAGALRASAEATHERLGGPGQWLVALPAHLISGLQMLVRSALSGIDPVFYDGPFDPAGLLRAAEKMEAERRYVSLVPVQLSRLLDLAERDSDAADALRAFDAVLVGGQAVSLQLRRRCHDLGVALKRSYGMSETAGGCVYDGVEIGDTRVRIREGEVQLAGPSLALGYVGDAALTADRFVLHENRDGTLTRWYRTGDAGELLGGMLTVTGRLDRVIVSGGVNVSLDEVERVVREAAGIESVVAVGAPHPEWGERVVLVVEAATPPAAVPAVEAARAALRERLGAAAVPDRVVEMEQLPRLAGGKVDLRALAESVRAHEGAHE
ncbi:AMP-binding protein [Leucobacter sp. gxy201]|uniref:AMP-binding protein n=1 Tax=Leucobacter sp. gxy201 TaxID=2957200 RepID=UPI003D9FE3C0